MLLVAILALVVLALLTDAGNPPASDDGSGDDAASDAPDDRQPTSTVAPPDVDEPRARVDLAVVPTGEDPVEVARWWAATYTAYVGSEVPGALADRLAPATSGTLQAELADLPPAASYDPEPAAVEGVSQQDPVGDGDQLRVRVTVETVGALALYDLALVQDAGSGRWLVDEASRV